MPANGVHSHNVRFRAVDIAGNRGEWSDTQDIHMDTEAPSKATVSLTNYTSGAWTNQSIVQTYSATDGLSNINYYEYSYDKTKIIGTTTSNWTLTSDGTYTIYARAVDNAGNRGAWSNSYTINRDTVKPNCSLTVSNSPSAVGEWYTSDVNIGFNTKTDDRSGVKSGTVDITSITANTNGTTVTGTVVDNANNSNTCTLTIKADIAAPTITAKANPLSLGNGDYAFTSNVTATYGGLGGTTTCNPATSNKTGTYNVTCTATGNNGKSGSVTFGVRHSYAATPKSYTYSCNPHSCSYACGEECGQSCSCSNYGWCYGELCCTEQSCTPYCNTKYCTKTCYDTCTGTKYECPNGGTLSGTTCYY